MGAVGVGEKRIGAGGRVVGAGGIGGKRIKANGGVVGAAGVGVKRARALGRAVGAAGVGGKRAHALRRVVGAGRVGEKRAKTHPRVVRPAQRGIAGILTGEEVERSRITEQGEIGQAAAVAVDDTRNVRFGLTAPKADDIVIARHARVANDDVAACAFRIVVASLIPHRDVVRAVLEGAKRA